MLVEAVFMLGAHSSYLTPIFEVLGEGRNEPTRCYS